MGHGIGRDNGGNFKGLQHLSSCRVAVADAVEDHEIGPVRTNRGAAGVDGQSLAAFEKDLHSTIGAEARRSG